MHRFPAKSEKKVQKNPGYSMFATLKNKGVEPLHQIEPFLVPQITFQLKMIKVIFFIESNFFLYKEPFVERKDSMDVEGSSWNHQSQ